MFRKRALAFISLVGIFTTGISMLVFAPPPATPPARAYDDHDCVLHAVAYAANMRTDLVAEITGNMEGPAINGDEIPRILRATGFGVRIPHPFSTREELISYLRSNYNAAFIVGWQSREGGTGHVINARVINGGEPIFIDSQCGSFATVPADQGIYYAWFVEPILFGEAERMMQGLTKRDASYATSSGGFTPSCQNIALFTDVDRHNSVNLSAECRNNAGTLTPTAINLNYSIINSFGGLLWQDNGGFGASVRNCQLRDSEDVTVLQCEANDGNGSWEKAAINLDDRIANDNGQLAVRF